VRHDNKEGGVPGGVKVNAPNETPTSTLTSTSDSSPSSPGLLDAMSEADAAYVMSLITHAIMGRGLHSSTSQLNLSYS